MLMALNSKHLVCLFLLNLLLTAGIKDCPAIESLLASGCATLLAFILVTEIDMASEALRIKNTRGARILILAFVLFASVCLVAFYIKLFM